MIHIAPWTAAIGLMRGAAAVLPLGGILYSMVLTAEKAATPHPAIRPSTRPPNARSRLARARSRSGSDMAEAHGFAKPLIVEMPANNISLIFHGGAYGG